MKIILATDGSSYSATAARTLVALGPPPDAELFILHVKEAPTYLVTPAVPPSYLRELHKAQQELHAEAEETAKHAIAQAEQILATAGLKTQSNVREGHPADEIVCAAKEIGADLVVAGSKGLGGSTMFMLGSVSQKVLKYAPCSVLLTKSGDELGQPRISSVILATDGSGDAEDAARFLSSFQLREDSQITILNVIHQPHGLALSAAARQALEQIHQSRLAEAERQVRATQSLLHARAKVATAVREGDPSEQILKAGSEMNADLIVVGSAGLSGVKLFLLGSVSQRVCRYSDRPVLLVKMRHESNPSAEEEPQ